MFIFSRFEIVGWLNIKLTVLISTEDKNILQIRTEVKCKSHIYCLKRYAAKEEFVYYLLTLITRKLMWKGVTVRAHSDCSLLNLYSKHMGN